MICEHDFECISTGKVSDKLILSPVFKCKNCKGLYCSKSIEESRIMVRIKTIED